MSRISLSEQISAVRREIGQRERVYPRLVSAGKKRQGEVEYEIACMEQVLKTLLFVQRHHEEIVKLATAKGESAQRSGVAS